MTRPSRASAARDVSSRVRRLAALAARGVFSFALFWRSY